MEISKLDKSCISNPKFEIANWTHGCGMVAVQSQISDFGFEMQDSSDFETFPCTPATLWALIERPYNRTPVVGSSEMRVEPLVVGRA